MDKNLYYHYIIFFVFVSLAFFRIGLTWFNYIYYPVFVIALIRTGYILVKYKIYKIYKYFLPFILVSFIFLLRTLPNINGINSFLAGESLKVVETYIFIILSVFFIFISRASIYNRILYNARFLFLLVPLILSVLGLLKFLYRMFSFNIEILRKLNLDFPGSSLVSDHNLFALCLVIGIIILLFSVFQKNLRGRNFFYLIFLVVSLAILFSGSRRGFIVFLVLLVLFIYFLLSEQNIEKKFKQSGFLSLGILFLLSFTIYGSYTKLEGKTKLAFIDKLNISPYEYKYKLGSIIYDYQTVFKSEESYKDFISGNWDVKFDPRNPMTYFDKNYKEYYPLPDSLYEEIPASTSGYYIDKNTNVHSRKNTAVALTKFDSLSAKKGEKLRASVYCYVSPEFNGSRVFLHAGKNNNTYGLENSSYNLSKMGKWQKLYVQPIVKESGNIPFNLVVFKTNAEDFHDLEGHVIFAYPRARKTNFDPKDPLSGWATRRHKQMTSLPGDNSHIVPKGSIGYKLDSSSNFNFWNGDAYSFTKIFSKKVRSRDTCYSSVYCYVSKDFDGECIKIAGRGTFPTIPSDHYNMENKGKWQKLSFKSVCKKGKISAYMRFKYPNASNKTEVKKMNGFVVFAHPEYEIIRNSENKGGDKQGIKADIRQNSIFMPVLNIPFFDNESRLASPRIKRWLFAWEIFKDYSFTQKLLGNGFEYLDLYNEKFYPNKDKIDYPHNPIISSFLYSGIIGGLVYVWFLLTSLYYYYKYRKEFGLLFLLYLVTGFFIFFSFNSHFSIPAFSMLSVVPFVINYYKKKIESNDRTT